MGGDEISEGLAQLLDVRGAGAQNLGGGRVIEQSEQQVLHRDELVPLLARFDERHVETDFEFLRNHVSSKILIGTGGVGASLRFSGFLHDAL
jgi:hypothetical protein